MRQRRGLSQREVEERAALGASSLSRYERGQERPSLETLWKILAAMDCDLHDLAIALGDESDGTARVGRPRAEWVSALSRRGISDDVLFGFAAGALSRDDAESSADFVASVEAAAREIAEHTLSQLYAEAPSAELQVAEPITSYAPTRQPPPKRQR